MIKISDQYFSQLPLFQWSIEHDLIYVLSQRDYLLERDLRFVGIASSAMLGKHAPNGDYFNIVAIVTSIKGDTAIYKVS